MNIVGYKIGGQDNDTYMFRDDSSLQKCDGCGYRLDFYATNRQYCLKKSGSDISATYDGQTIVSQIFKEFCEQNKFKGVKFVAFENDPNHFHLTVTPEVKFDAIRSKTRFENLCSQCGNYESIVGAKPAYLLAAQPLRDGFYRTDLIFASGNEKHPLILVGQETKAKLEAASLVGLEFSPAYGID
jgi:hypothetical protein